MTPFHQKQSKTPCDQFQAETFLTQGYVSYRNFKSIQHLPRTNPFLCMTHLGEERCEPSHDFCTPRSEYHLHFVLSGKGMLALNGTVHHLSQGDLFLIPKQTPYYYRADPQQPWHYCWIAFDGNQVQKYLQRCGFEAPSFVRRSYDPIEQYHLLVTPPLQAVDASDWLSFTPPKLLYQVFALLMRSQFEHTLTQKPSHAQQDLYIMQALCYMEANYQTTTVTEVANMVGLHRSYFSALFRDCTNLSPQAYLVTLKMQQAATLLTTTDTKITDIASLLGYDDAFSFSKMFHRYYHIAPRAYRKTYENAATPCAPPPEGFSLQGMPQNGMQFFCVASRL